MSYASERPPRKPKFKFELPGELARRLSCLESDLRNYADEADAAWQRHGLDRWRESDEGNTVRGWVDDLYELADAVLNLPDEAVERKRR
jgi:hypothetical protein